MGKTRLNGENPKIGIRPIIDGRRGDIRESLEDMTMNMARRVADLYASSLHYSNGDPVECVIAGTTIGGVAGAARVNGQLEKQGVGVILSVSPYWCYGFETINMDGDLPRAIWGFNGTERPGAAYLAATLAVHNQKGLPTFGIYDRDVQDVSSEEVPEDVKERLLRFAKADLTVATMRGKAYLSIGSVSMGIDGSIPNPDFFQDYLGMRNEYVDASEIGRRIKLGIYDHEGFDKAMAWTEKYCKTNEGEDHNPKHLIYSRGEEDAVWEYVIKMTIIFRDLMIGNPRLAEMGFKGESNGHYALMGGFQGRRQWTNFKPDGDFSEAILNSSFDWNGIREAFTFATENDTLNGVSMLFNKLLSDRAQIFADVRTYWSPAAYERVTGQKLEGDAANGFIHLINSGSCTLDDSGRQTENGKPAMKPFWEIQEKEAETCLQTTAWCPSNRDYMRGGGFSAQFQTKGGMPLTMCRLNLIKGQGPVLQIAEGWSIKLNDKSFATINERADAIWPSTFFAPRLTGKGYFKDVCSVMNDWGANHGAISYEHIGTDLITLASMLRIPVYMHNIPEEQIFRPSTWTTFGEDMEGSDFRACKNFGPLYK